MQVFGDEHGDLRFSAYETGLPELAWIIESGVMHHELWQTLKRQHNVTVFTEAECAALHVAPEHARLALADGRELRARLVVGADGANSWVREQIGILANFKPYGELGVVANFRCEQSHHGVAYQWFREDGVLAMLPLHDQQMSMVWLTPTAHAQELLALAPEVLCQRVSAAMGEDVAARLGSLTVVTPATGFPLRFMRTEATVRHRVALLGDAAHAIHPLSGHGINLGYQDARVLAELISALPAWADPGEPNVLRRYARARAEEPMVLQYSTHALHGLFKRRDPLAGFVRNHGMNLVGRLPVLKQLLVRYATSGHL